MSRETLVRVGVVAVAAAAAVLLVAVAAPATDSNQVSYWCEQGVKVEPVDTPFIVPEPEEGTTWTLLVLKAGTVNETVAYPIVGSGYSPSSGKDISHVILCWEDQTTTTTTTEPPSTTTTSTVPTTTSSLATTTTTTVPVTTTSSSTTTTEPPTTTTPSPPTESSSTVPPTTPTTTQPELPNTGAPIGTMTAVGLAAAALGVLTVAATMRREDQPESDNPR